MSHGRRLKTFVILCAAVALLGGCVHRMVGAAVGGFRVGEAKVTSFARRDVGSKQLSYCLYSADPTVSSNDLPQVYVRSKVDAVLRLKGYTRATSEQGCQQAVLVSFGHGRPPSSLSPRVLDRMLGEPGTPHNTEETAAARIREDDPSRWIMLWSVDRTRYVATGEAIELWRTEATTQESKSVRRQGAETSAVFLLAAAADYIGEDGAIGEDVRVRTRDDVWGALLDDESQGSQ